MVTSTRSKQRVVALCVSIVNKMADDVTRKCFHIPDKEEISLIIKASRNMTSSGKQTFISPYNKGHTCILFHYINLTLVMRSFGWSIAAHVTCHKSSCHTLGNIQTTLKSKNYWNEKMLKYKEKYSVRCFRHFLEESGGGDELWGLWNRRTWWNSLDFLCSCPKRHVHVQFVNE
jgi:hypothetical protein